VSSHLIILSSQQFEADVLKKQLEYAGRITDLEARLATFHNRLAVEAMDRGREHANTLEVRQHYIIRILVWIIIFCILYLLVLRISY